MKKSMVVKVGAEALIDIFVAIVGVDNLKFSIKLSLDHHME